MEEDRKINNITDEQESPNKESPQNEEEKPKSQMRLVKTTSEGGRVVQEFIEKGVALNDKGELEEYEIPTTVITLKGEGEEFAESPEKVIENNPRYLVAE